MMLVFLGGGNMNVNRFQLRECPYANPLSSVSFHIHEIFRKELQ